METDRDERVYPSIVIRSLNRERQRINFTATGLWPEPIERLGMALYGCFQRTADLARMDAPSEFYAALDKFCQALDEIGPQGPEKEDANDGDDREAS